MPRTDGYSKARVIIEDALNNARLEVRKGEALLAALLGVKATAKNVKKRKGGMSAKGRKAIAAAQRARWAKVKAAKAK